MADKAMRRFAAEVYARLAELDVTLIDIDEGEEHLTLKVEVSCYPIHLHDGDIAHHYKIDVGECLDKGVSRTCNEVVAWARSAREEVERRIGLDREAGECIEKIRSAAMTHVLGGHLEPCDLPTIKLSAQTTGLRASWPDLAGGDVVGAASALIVGEQWVDNRKEGMILKIIRIAERRRADRLSRERRQYAVGSEWTSGAWLEVTPYVGVDMAASGERSYSFVSYPNYRRRMRAAIPQDAIDDLTSRVRNEAAMVIDGRRPLRGRSFSFEGDASGSTVVEKDHDSD